MRSTFLSLLLLTAAFALPVRADNEGSGKPEVLHRPNPHQIDSVPAGSTGVVTPSMSYGGGALITVPTIYYIWYGNWNQSNGSDTASGRQILDDLAVNIGGSPYFQINTTYATSAYPIDGSVAFGGEAFDPYSRGSRLRDSDLLTIVRTAIQNKKLPYDKSGVYFVLTSTDVTEQTGFCNRYCGWHTSGTISQGTVRYAFVGNANRCLYACAAQSVGPNGNAGVDGMASVIAHELEEATTDPDPLSGWSDGHGSENADKCAWTFGQNMSIAPNGALYNMTLGVAKRPFLIQRNLKHSASGDTCNVNLLQQ
jgi:hypothetical protein